RLDGMTQFSLSVFPMKMELDVTLNQQIFSQNDSGLIDLQGLAGVTKKANEPVFILAMEAPITKRTKRSKSEKETDDVRAFLAACTPSSKIIAIAPGPDGNEPPDCLADIDDRRYAIETAQLMLPSRNAK